MNSISTSLDWNTALQKAGIPVKQCVAITRDIQRFIAAYTAVLLIGEMPREIMDQVKSIQNHEDFSAIIMKHATPKMIQENVREATDIVMGEYFDKLIGK